MRLRPPQQDFIRYLNAFKEFLDALPIIPIQLIIEVTQYAAFFEYILRVGAILSGDTIIPDVDDQFVELPLDLKQPFIYVYFNLIKAVYFQFRGMTDKGKECCEKTFLAIHNILEQSPYDPDLDMVIWSYWLVHRQVSL